jgi:hypothetical protein
MMLPERSDLVTKFILFYIPATQFGKGLNSCGIFEIESSVPAPLAH